MTCRRYSCSCSARARRLPGLAGVIAGPALVTQPDMASLLGPILFVVIVVGGLGSLTGAFVASLLIGLVQTFAVAMNFSLAEVFGPAAPPFLGDLWQVTIAQLAPVMPYLLARPGPDLPPDRPHGNARVMTREAQRACAVAGVRRGARRRSARLPVGDSR